MAQRADVTRAQEILDRWCALAEQRLDHLTELFETGRWRRYHSEASFLENIQEAKRAVETWRSLATREASLDNSAVDISWLNSPKPVPPRRNPLSGYYPLPGRVEARLVPEIVGAPIAPRIDTPAPVIDDNWQQALDISAMQERYPLLRNAL